MDVEALRDAEATRASAERQLEQAADRLLEAKTRRDRAAQKADTAEREFVGAKMALEKAEQDVLALVRDGVRP